MAIAAAGRAYREDRERQRRIVHEWVSASPARLGPVREHARQRIAHRIEEQRDAERQARERPRKPVHLRVVEEQERGERVVLDAFGRLAEAVPEPRTRLQQGGRRGFRSGLVATRNRDQCADSQEAAGDDRIVQLDEAGLDPDAAPSEAPGAAAADSGVCSSRQTVSAFLPFQARPGSQPRRIDPHAMPRASNGLRESARVCARIPAGRNA